MNKEVVASVDITNEVVDKFHRALCPMCRGILPSARTCEYDYEHISEPEPHTNKHWRKYIVVLQELAKSYNMSFDDMYELLKNWEEAPEEKLEIVCETQSLFNRIASFDK